MSKRLVTVIPGDLAKGVGWLMVAFNGHGQWVYASRHDTEDGARREARDYRRRWTPAKRAAKRGRK